jgi:hypothetical protein
LTERGLARLLAKSEQGAEDLAVARGSGPRGARDGFSRGVPPSAAYSFYKLARTLRLDKAQPRPALAIEADVFAAALARYSPVPSFWGGDTRFRDLHDVSGALDDLDDCLARDPTFTEAAELRSDLLLACRDDAGVARAEKSFRGELARWPTDRAHMDLAVVLLGRGDLEGCERELATVRDARGDLLRAELARRKTDDAAAKEKRAAWKNARSGFLARRDLIALARARLLAKDPKAALEAIDEALKVKERDPAHSGLNRAPYGFQVVKALEAAARAALGQGEAAWAALAKAGTKQNLAPEATPAVLKRAPEFAAFRDDAAFVKFLGGAEGESGGDE